jgi:Na+-driven multidrug efflux pump
MYEVVSGALSCAVATVCILLILPFVMLYTDGVNDANYHQPLFALFAICASLVDMLTLPYKTLISAAGHYKQTKIGAIGEVSINLGLSLILIHSLGLVGVAIGTLAAMTFRLLYSVWYLSKDILNRPKRRFFKFVLPNLGLVALLVAIFWKFGDFYADSILQLFVNAIKVSVLVFPLFAVMNLLIYPKLFKMIIKKKE